MSVTGRLRTRGTPADVHRQTETRAADGSTQLDGWSAQTPTRVLIDSIAADVAARVFGDGVRVELRGIVALDADVAIDDGLVPQRGPFASQRFRVTGRHLAVSRARISHVELALVATTEAFDA